MTYEERNRAMKLIASVCLPLDRLQVELEESSPYRKPDAKETRERILSVFKALEELTEFIERQVPSPDKKG